MDAEAATTASQIPSDPPRIRRLPESVVNRIAAGEVVVRPSAALKELLENCLDANATTVTVTVRDGGLKLLQVSDDGDGISPDDLPLLCQRFATSKLRDYGDLATVATFGFRGEALASISHVSRLSVLTMREGGNVAYKAAYLDGEMRGAAQPAAGVRGTTFTIEDMFYNLPTRRAAIKSTSEEYRSIVDVVARYAIRYSNVAFICRRNQPGAASRLASASDVRTERGASLVDNVRAAFGNLVANEVIEYDVEVAVARARVSACLSSANFSMKKAVFILFINGRLVECQPFKRAVLAAYAAYLPKSGHPFAYFDVRMNQADIDVNVHPTKKEVRFLHDDIIIDAVVESLLQKLKTTETSRTFMTQSVITSRLSKMPTQLINKGEEDKGLDVADASDGDGSLGQREGGTELGGVQMCGSDSGPSSGGVEDDSSQGQKQRVFNSSRETQNEFDRGDADTETENTMPRAEQSGERQVDDDYVVDLNTAELDSTRVVSTRHSQVQFESPAKRRSEKICPKSKAKTLYAKDKVRSGSHAPVGLFDVYLARNDRVSEAVWIQTRRKRSPSAIPMLTSVESMLRDVERSGHSGYAEVLKDHLFVGIASERYVLLQHGTKLLLAEVGPILSELMFQQSLIRFADHEVLIVDPPAPVMRLLKHYLTGMGRDQGARLSAETCCMILLEKASMLAEYFGIGLAGQNAEDARISKLPMLFPSVMADMRYFGQFLYKLATETDWSEEGACLRGIAMCLGSWYGTHWTPLPSDDDKSGSVESQIPENDAEAPASTRALGKLSSEQTENKRREWVLRHILFASLRRDFHPPRGFLNRKVIREITSTSKLYKIFERC